MVDQSFLVRRGRRPVRVDERMLDDMQRFGVTGRVFRLIGGATIAHIGVVGDEAAAPDQDAAHATLSNFLRMNRQHASRVARVRGSHSNTISAQISGGAGGVRNFGHNADPAGGGSL